MGVAYIFAGLTHVFLGLEADAMLGAQILPDMMADASLDSQNRFYGACFTLYGMLFLHNTRDMERYLTVLEITLYFFFLGGIARLIPALMLGLPSPLIMGLAASELLIPPLIWLWLKKISRSAALA